MVEELVQQLVCMCVYISSVYGPVRLQGLCAEHLSDDRLSGSAVCGRSENPERVRQQNLTTLSCWGALSGRQRGMYVCIYINGRLSMIFSLIFFLL